MGEAKDAARADDPRVIAAFRLGWTLAELRGRVRLGDDDPGIPPPPPGRTQHALPLAGERSPNEQQIESERVLLALAKALDVDTDTNDLTGFKNTSGPATNHLTTLIRQARDTESHDDFFYFIWAWDAWIQDKLAEGPFGASSAYQLGRGLAEISWALDANTQPTSQASWSSWTFLLGVERVDALKRLVDRLASHFHEHTAPAIKGSLDAWHHAIATASVQDQPTAPVALRYQIQRWRDLVVAGLDPCLFADQHAASHLARKTRVITRLAGAVWPQLAIGALSVIVLVVAVFAIPDDTSTGAAGTILGALGITASSISAKAKSQANALLEHASESYREQLAIDATTILPTGIRRPDRIRSSANRHQ